MKKLLIITIMLAGLIASVEAQELVGIEVIPGQAAPTAPVNTVKPDPMGIIEVIDLDADMDADLEDESGSGLSDLDDQDDLDDEDLDEDDLDDEDEQALFARIPELQ